MFKEVYYPQVKAIGNCICEVLARKQRKYCDIAPLNNTMNFHLQYLDISVESFFFGIPVFNIRVSEYFMKGERELI